MSFVRTSAVVLALALLGAAAAAAVPPLASASHAQSLTFEAPRDLLDAGRRGAALDELAGLGVRSLRVVLYWRSVAPSPESRVRPTFDATDPASYNWGEYVPVLQAAADHGWPVLLTVSGPVPRWATEGARDSVTRPRPKEFRKFMTAVARRFGGQVGLWSIWNEPNHPQFLGPQYDSKGRPVSPRIYRALFQAGQRGLSEAGWGSAPLLLAETAPRGTGKVVAPLTFLRGTLCLDSRYRRAAGCKPLDVDGYAHHAYTTRAGPFFRPRQPNDVTIGVLARLVTALDRAARAGALPARLPVYLTEFGIQSKPDPYYGVSFMQQYEYRAISERIAYDNPRVAAFSQYLLTDDRPREGVPASARFGGFESGLITNEGRRKPAFYAFRLPVAVRRVGGGKVSMWGLVRPAAGSVQTLTVQISDGGGAFKRLAVVKTDEHGYWRIRGLDRSKRRWRVVWTAPGGTVYTAPAVRAYSW